MPEPPDNIFVYKFLDIGKRYLKWKRAVERSMKWETPVSDLGTVFINTKCKWYRTSLEGHPHFLIKNAAIKTNRSAEKFFILQEIKCKKIREIRYSTKVGICK